MTMLREQRPPTSDRKPGARSNRPNSTSALARCDHLVAFASICPEGINFQLLCSIWHGLDCLSQKIFATLLQNAFWMFVSICGEFPRAG